MASSPAPQKTVLITGASIGGIGGELAKEFHSKGFRVFAAVRRPEAAQELTALGIETIQLDVTNSDDIRRVRDDVSQKTGGRLDVLVNNAGFGHNCPATDLEIDTVVKQIFEINLFAVMRMVQEFAHLLIAAEGTIVNIGSIAAITPLVFGSAYNASKAALHSYGDTLRVELKPFNVKVMTIVTGGVKSNIARYSIEHPTLPPDSLYQPILSYYKRSSGNLQVGAMPTDAYARTVVAQVMKPDWRKPVWYWQGTASMFVWLAYTFCWQNVFDYILMKSCGLLKLERIRKEGKEGKKD